MTLATLKTIHPWYYIFSVLDKKYSHILENILPGSEILGLMCQLVKVICALLIKSTSPMHHCYLLTDMIIVCNSGLCTRKNQIAGHLGVLTRTRVRGACALHHTKLIRGDPLPIAPMF